MRKLAGTVAVATGIALTGLAAAPTGALAAPSSVESATAVPVVTGTVSIQSTGPFAAYAPPGGKYGAESKSNTAILGNYDTYVYYSWSVAPGTISSACVDGWVPWGKDPKKGTWYSLGCGKSGGGKGILWGSYAALPKVRAKGVTTGASIQWFH
ncbi:hypothetical protein ACIA49_24710 [Kribbella sp. NPDC051587]|uniref:hypothetical protein n=1 Tax=Kribbella sp. NPDC051587 TaxID=3364119 RepID=UPI0037890995